MRRRGAPVKAPARLAAGARLGRYVVESRLAQGGMGEVWLATARGPGGFQKRVVIKTVLPELVEKPGYAQMLVREASLAARLDHPNIVHVFDLGCVDGLHYIAMEYLSGRSLAQMLRRSQEVRRRLPVAVVLAMVAASCDGLQYAHDYADDNGQPLAMLHRDISPSNIMLTFAGRVALLDFGVATAAPDPYQTRSGALKGKFHYLAPERIRGEPADRRSDVYSMGVVLYQCLALRWPFHAPNDFELLHQIAHDPPMPLRHYAPWIPSHLEDIVLRAMASRVSERYDQAHELALALRAYLRGTGEVTQAPELALCLGGLFPEAPEVARSKTPVPPAPDPTPAVELSSAEVVYVQPDSGVSTDVEQVTPQPPPAPPVVTAAPAPTGPTKALPKARPLPRAPTRAAGSGPVWEGNRSWARVRNARTRPLGDGVDIFPTPTRILEHLAGSGVDLFDGYTRSAHVLAEPNPGAEVGERPWPWAKTVEPRSSDRLSDRQLTKEGRTRHGGGGFPP